MTRYFVDSDGKYIGGFDGAAPPKDTVEVAYPPQHAGDTWTGSAYDTSTRPASSKPLTAESLAEALKAKGVLTDSDISKAKE